MNAIPLFTENGHPTNISYCDICLKPNIHEVAENCCKKGVCKQCRGETISIFNEKCYDCRDKDQMDKAEKLENWDGPVVLNDSYYTTLEDLVDCNEIEKLPEFVYIAETKNIPKLDTEDILERFCENLYEDAYDNLNGVAEFEEAVNAFNKANKGNTFWIESMKKAARVPRESK